MRTSGDIFDAGQPINAIRPGRGPGRKINGNRARGINIGSLVKYVQKSRSANQRIIAKPAMQQISVTAGTSIQRVIAGAAGQRISAVPAIDQIIATTAIKPVIAVQAGDGVITRAGGAASHTGRDKLFRDDVIAAGTIDVRHNEGSLCVRL